MRKLLRANFARLWKDKVFWGALVVLACYGVLGCISQYRLVEEGYDVTREPIPVVPAQHYFMGGIWVDSDSMTSMEHLYAVGETSCNGVHGANRLASNSLLESLVFAKRAARKIGQEYAGGEDMEEQGRMRA